MPLLVYLLHGKTLLPDFVLDWLARLRDGRNASAKRIYAFYSFFLRASFVQK